LGFEEQLAFAPLYSSLVLQLDSSEPFDRVRDAEFFAGLPSRPGVVLIEMREPGRPYLARTADIRRAAQRLLGVPEENSKRLNLRELAARILYRATGSKFEQTLTLYEQARELLPDRYRELLRLRPPAVLKINLRNAYPRCHVTRRIRADEGVYFGPFASRRSAEAFSESFLDLFKIRRCQIKIRRDPNFPGCIYSEMKMCLAPCFAGCSKEEYDAEVALVVETLDTAGGALTAKFEREREAASEVLDFERAAALHKRLEKVAAALRGLPELARRVEELDAVILQRGNDEKTIVVFPMLRGVLDEAIFLNFAELSSQPRSVEAILRQALQPQTTTVPRESGESGAIDLRKRYGLHAAAEELPEHLSLVARWFYSKPRGGEILFREDDWPYRRILRACSRLLAPDTSSPEPPGS
jgi:excinuclease UvrABC nuclease subunit